MALIDPDGLAITSVLLTVLIAQQRSPYAAMAAADASQPPDLEIFAGTECRKALLEKVAKHRRA